MIETFEKNLFKPIGVQNKKNQIILTHTSRNFDDYLNSLKYRMAGKYTKIPNYIITREGKVIQTLKNKEYGSFFKEININRNSIIITLENLGWLEKEPLTGNYINWIGDIYNGPVFDRKWRDYFFWQPYTTSQISKTIEICKNICNEMSIKKNLIGHNTKINGIEKFKGIVTKSNFDNEVTDLSPAFNFEEFTKEFENE
jgi:N-acetyl-anhydromuramyl-L-alanine amidase AmpD